MKVSVFKLSGRALDVAVAKAEGATDFEFDGFTWGFSLNGSTKVLAKGWVPPMCYCPSTDWNVAGPLIERDCIGVEKHRLDGPYQWAACDWHPVVVQGYTCLERSHYVYGATQLEAAMRCFVIKHIGKEIDIPEELL